MSNAANFLQKCFIVMKSIFSPFSVGNVSRYTNDVWGAFNFNDCRRHESIDQPAAFCTKYGLKI